MLIGCPLITGADPGTGGGGAAPDESTAKAATWLVTDPTELVTITLYEAASLVETPSSARVAFVQPAMGTPFLSH